MKHFVKQGQIAVSAVTENIMRRIKTPSFLNKIPFLQNFQELPRLSDLRKLPAFTLLKDLKPGPVSERSDWRLLFFCEEAKPDLGEDSFLVRIDEKRIMLGVFDGCGGSGAKVYPSFDGHTGAWVASRAAAAAAGEWFMAVGSEEESEDSKNYSLADHIADALQSCKDQVPEKGMLLGSLSRDFPTTVALFYKEIEGDETIFEWCGDSRCYVLDEDGLHQVTTDDSAVPDAMQNLREDAPMNNVASASAPFVLHRKCLGIKKPSFVFAATDGCFGYLTSPMAFEDLMLRSLLHAKNPSAWENRIKEELRKTAGDDYTLTGLAFGFSSFDDMKRLFVKRLKYLEKNYSLSDGDEKLLLAQWEKYKAGYESFMTCPAQNGTEGTSYGND